MTSSLAQTGRAKFYLLAAVALAALVAWALWPQSSGPVGPSITERLAQTGKADPDSLSAKVISSDDLPPEGTRSLFDHLIAQNEQLPYPFERLVALVESYNPEPQAALGILIPEGRSLLKAQADFGRPRVLVAPDYHAPNTETSYGVAPRGRLFLGFVENAAEIEVISYNEAAGRFEFQLVQDYREGGVPRIVYARRAICTTCHQGAAPIFPQRPWSETNAQPEIAAKVAEARGGSPYLGMPVSNPLSAPERFDELTDVGNFIPVTQRIWIDGCGDGEEGAQCRRLMLRLAFDYLWNPGDFDANGDDANRLRELQTRHWPEAGIGVPESDIRNRDPLEGRRGVRGFLRALFTPESTEPGAKTNEDLSAFERLPQLRAEFDPLTPRPFKRILYPRDLDGVYGLATFFTADDLELIEQLADYDRAHLATAVEQIPDGFFRPAPFSRVRTVNAVLTYSGRQPRGYAFTSTANMSPPVAAGAPPLEVSEGSALTHYEKYCFACHRGNPAARLDFMAGGTEDEVLARIRETSSIRDALDWERYRGTDKEGTLMPPADSRQRAALEQALAGGEPVLEEMRKVVPGMFDF